MAQEIMRPCGDCYRLVRATFEGSVGNLIIRHLSDCGVERTKVENILTRHLRSDDDNQATISERHLSCDSCGAAFVIYPDREPIGERWVSSSLFWIGWRKQ